VRSGGRVLLFLALLGVYALTLGDTTAGEARYLLTAESIVSDGDVDVRDEYRSQVYREWIDVSEPLMPVSGLTNGRLHELTGVGLPVLVAPAYALGGVVGAQLFVAALLALGFAVAAALARRLVPDPWATGGAAVVGLSPVALGWSTAVSPEPVAACLVAVAALGALRVRDRPTFRSAVAAALAIAVLPWLAVKLLPLAAVAAAALARWLRRRRRGLVAFAALEVVLTSAVALVTVNERLYGGLTPYAAAPGSPTGASGLFDHLERGPRLLGALVDGEFGLLVWAPVVALALLGTWRLWRAWREHIEVALPGVVDVEVGGGFLAGVCAVQLAVAAFLAPSLDAGDAFPVRELVPVLPAAAALVALGLRYAGRAGLALCLLTVAASVWLLAGARLGDGSVVPPAGPVPWEGAGLAVAAVAVVTVGALVGADAWRERALLATPAERHT